LYKLFPNAVIEAHLKDFVREESSVQNVKNEDSKGKKTFFLKKDRMM